MQVAWMRRIGSACLAVLVAAPTLTACGGGGAGSDSGTGLRLSNVQALGTTQRVYASITPIGIVSITADVSGDLSRLNGRTIYVIVTDPDGLFEATPAVTIMPNGIGNSIRLFGKATVGRTGTYRGPLTLRVCLDIACNQQFDGSPVELPLQIDVLPGLQVASPLIVDLAFGQAPTTIEVPVTVPVDAAGFSATLTPLPGKNDGAIFYEHLNAPMQGLRITPRRLPVGSYTQTFTLSGTAFVGPVPYLLQTTLPVTINVRPTPGLEFAIDPPQLALQALSTGIVIPEAYVAEVTVLAADGLRYSDVSRVQYLPAGPGGVLDAGGIAWLRVEATPLAAARDWDNLYSALAVACETVPTTRCLGPGRYAANVYFGVPGGAESPVPLPVTVDVR